MFWETDACCFETFFFFIHIYSYISLEFALGICLIIDFFDAVLELTNICLIETFD